MPFNPNIPQATDRLAKSQQDLLNNNQQLDTSFGINHYAFSDLTANNGMHKQCQLVEQVGAPVPGAGTDSLYTFVTAIPLGELFFVRGGAGTPIQMTNGNTINASTGLTFLPGGMIMQFGTTTLNVSSQASVTFSPTFKLAGINTAPWCVQVTLKTSNPTSKSVWAEAVTFNKLDILGFNAAGRDVFWMAIGPRT